MILDLQKQYKQLIEQVKDETIIFSPDLPNSLSEREKLWLEIAPIIYVIGEDFGKFDQQAKEQGFFNLLYKVKVKHLLEFPIAKNLRDWFTEKVSIGNVGCHISHAIVASHLLSTKNSHALIFEEDCAFNNLLSEAWLVQLRDWYSSEYLSKGFVNLGTNRYTSRNHYPFEVGTVIYENNHFTVEKNQGPLTHSYLINREIAKKLLNSINVDLKKPIQIFLKEDNDEQYYRGGADDFFIRYVDQFGIFPAITYQQKILHNIARKPQIC